MNHRNILDDYRALHALFFIFENANAERQADARQVTKNETSVICLRLELRQN